MSAARLKANESVEAAEALASRRPATRFRDLDEAALFDERAAIREHEGGLPRASAERLAWLDVLAARQIAAGALTSLNTAPVFSGGVVARNQSGKVATKETSQ